MLFEEDWYDPEEETTCTQCHKKLLAKKIKSWVFLPSVENPEVILRLCADCDREDEEDMVKQEKDILESCNTDPEFRKMWEEVCLENPVEDADEYWDFSGKEVKIRDKTGNEVIRK
jgi:hypothetical protein